jgi:type II secretory pathway pseudopilin PulG
MACENQKRLMDTYYMRMRTVMAGIALLFVANHSVAAAFDRDALDGDGSVVDFSSAPKQAAKKTWHDSNSALENAPSPYDPIFHDDGIPGTGYTLGFGLKKDYGTADWSVSVAVDYSIPTEAGHNHGAAKLPELRYYPHWPDTKATVSLKGTTVQSGMLTQDENFYIHLSTVSYAAVITAYGYYTEISGGTTTHPSLTEIVRMRVPGLVTLPRNDTIYISTGATTEHPQNHYGTPNTIAALEKLATDWRKTYPNSPLLEIGNISLPWGGAFDTGNDWRKKNYRHSFGVAADLGRENMTESERANLIKLMCSSGFQVYAETEKLGEEHYHIVLKDEFDRLNALQWPMELDGKENVPDCCAAMIGTEVYKRCTGN